MLPFWGSSSTLTVAELRHLPQAGRGARSGAVDDEPVDDDELAVERAERLTEK
jgi:hypothetical protein